MTTFCTFVIAGHVFVVIAPEDNEGEGLEYHIGVVVVTDTWLRQYSMKNSNLWLFEDWQTKRNNFHYSNLVVT
jgi:hypothetical protein